MSTREGRHADEMELRDARADEVEPEADDLEGRRRRGIYLVPNLITTGALFAGFYAIVAGMNGNFVPAALAIFVAMALDTADGRVARWTRTESRFGAEYDSLSDMVAFGVADGVLQGALELGLGLARKADDNIGSNRHFRHPLADAIDRHHALGEHVL